MSDEDWASVRLLRGEDLLDYLELAFFGKRPRLSELSRKLQREVRGSTRHSSRGVRSCPDRRFRLQAKRHF